MDAPVQYGPRLAGAGVYLFHGRFLSKARTAAAVSDLFGADVAPGTVTSWTSKTAATITDQVLPVITDRIADAPVAHFDETGLRTAGRLAWLHSASTDTDVLLTAHQTRGTKAMDAAGVLPEQAIDALLAVKKLTEPNPAAAHQDVPPTPGIAHPETLTEPAHPAAAGVPASLVVAPRAGRCGCTWW
ncbi:MAG: IS66 family transposase [Pseudonocardiaceae bacterium]